MLPVAGPGFRGNFGATLAELLTQIRSEIARAEGPGTFGQDVGPFALAFRSKPVQIRPRKPGQGNGSIIKQPKALLVRSGSVVGPIVATKRPRFA